MPMSNDAKFEKVQRLLTAHGRTKKTLEKEPVVWELHPGTDIAQNWPVITAAYSGLEQTIKYLTAEEKGLTVQELFDFAVAENGQANEDGRRHYPYRTHNLGRLFSRLEERTKKTVREVFKRYKSLFPQIRIGSVDQFLHRVSGGNGDGDGSVRWRYALIEEKTLPRNTPAALVAIWGVCVQIAQERAWGNQRVRVQMPDDELGEELCAHLERFAEAVSEERQKPADPFPDIRGEIGSWFRKRGHPLNAFAEVLWHFARHDHSGAADAPDWLSESLTRWARELAKEAADSGPTLLRQFVIRAQGHTVHGQSARWDPNRTRFESVPWSLRKRFQDAPPANAVVVGDQPVRHASPLCSLWIAADESGYRVHENRAFTGPPNQDPWFCTLEVTAENGGNVESVLSMWQQRRNAHDNLFHMVEECEPDAIGQPVRRWIDTARFLGRLRTERPSRDRTLGKPG